MEKNTQYLFKELLNLANSFIFYDNLSYNQLFPNLKEENLLQLSYDTYTNLCKENHNLEEDGNELFHKTFHFFSKISQKYDENSDQYINLMQIPNVKKTMYNFFLYVVHCLDILKNNTFILFLYSIPNAPFSDFIDKPQLCDSLQFIQKLITIAINTINIHKKRININKKRKYL